LLAIDFDVEDCLLGLLADLSLQLLDLFLVLPGLVHVLNAEDLSRLLGLVLKGLRDFNHLLARQLQTLDHFGFDRGFGHQVIFIVDSDDLLAALFAFLNLLLGIRFSESLLDLRSHFLSLQEAIIDDFVTDLSKVITIRGADDLCSLSGLRVLEVLEHVFVIDLGG